MTISTQTQYTSQMDEAKVLSAAAQTKNDTKATEVAASSIASAFEITDVFERSTDTSATDKLKTYSNITKTASVNKAAAANSAVSSAAAVVTASSATSDASSTAALLDSASSESSEEESTTETIYNADGSVYEKTTTTDEDGNETVTMTKIADAKEAEVVE